MKSHYCILCGFEIPFASTRPNFCPECRAPQNTTASRASAPAPVPVAKRRQPVYVEDEEEFGEEIIAEADVKKIISSLTPQAIAVDSGVVSMKDVVGTSSGPDPLGDDGLTRPIYTQEKFKAWKNKQDKLHSVIHTPEEES